MAKLAKKGCLYFGQFLPSPDTNRDGEGLAIIIPTAAQSKRLKSHGPLALLELRQGETVLSRQLTLLRKRFPFAEIYIVTGFQADKIYQHVDEDVRVLENESYEETNVVRSIDLALRACPAKRVLIVYGDLVFNKATFEGCTLERSWVLVDEPVDGETQLNALEVGVNVVDGQVMRFAYGLRSIWGQVLYLTGQELAIFRRFAVEREKHRCFGFELLNHVLDAGGVLASYSPPGMKLVEIDCCKDIELAQRIR